MVELFIAHGADLNVPAKYNFSALMLAVINRQADVVALLCGAGADKGIRGTGALGFAGRTALDLAVSAGYDDIATVIRSADS
jgi:ankyrin repeat protein